MLWKIIIPSGLFIIAGICLGYGAAISGFILGFILLIVASIVSK